MKKKIKKTRTENLWDLTRFERKDTIWALHAIVEDPQLDVDQSAKKKLIQWGVDQANIQGVPCVYIGDDITPKETEIEGADVAVNESCANFCADRQRELALFRGMGFESVDQRSMEVELLGKTHVMTAYTLMKKPDLPEYDILKDSIAERCQIG